MPARLWPLAAAAAAACVGLVVLVAGLLVATVGAPPAVETLTVKPGAEASSVVTAPGVLELLAERVEVRAQAPQGRRVVLAVARADDALAYLGKAPAIEVTGRDGEGVAVTRTLGSASDALPDPTTVDIWADASQPAPEAVLAWTARPGRWVLVAATVPGTGGGEVAAPASLSLSWRPVRGASPAVPLVAIGLLLLVAGGVAAGVIVVQRRSPVDGETDDETDDDAAPPADAGGEGAGPRATAVPTGPLTAELPVVPAGSVPSSRRAARAAREAAEAAGRSTSATARPRTGAAAPSAQSGAVPEPPPPPPTDPATTLLSLGRHRTSDLFAAQPLPGRRAARSGDDEGPDDQGPDDQGRDDRVRDGQEGRPSGDGPVDPTPAFRFRGETAAPDEGEGR